MLSRQVQKLTLVCLISDNYQSTATIETRETLTANVSFVSFLHALKRKTWSAQIRKPS